MGDIKSNTEGGRNADISEKITPPTERFCPSPENLRKLPKTPGVYIFYGASDYPIYVGKAIDIHSRVSQHFSRASTDYKDGFLSAQTTRIEYIVCDSEFEALLLENNLIKQHAPKYNIRLKDDKTYPLLKITLADEFPGIFVTRKVASDGARYFGPYINGGYMNRSLKILRQAFPLRTCADVSRRKRACLDHHIGLCPAPCVGKISGEEYAKLVQNAALFLSGRIDEVAKRIETDMKSASAKQDFERAALLRDSLTALHELDDRTQKATGPPGQNQDVFGYARDADFVYVQALFVRRGKIVGHRQFRLSDKGGAAKDAEIAAALISQYYQTAEEIPDEVVVPVKMDASEAPLILEFLSKKAGGRVEIIVPERGQKRRLLEMAQRNAQEYMLFSTLEGKTASRKAELALGELARVLRLKEKPHIIWCFDVSHISGKEMVGSQVEFRDGTPHKSGYRRFRIKTVEGVDDYAAMNEVVYRRFARAVKEPKNTESGGNLPGLVIIDGGPGQLKSAKAALSQAGLGKIPIASLAKENEEIFMPHSAGPIALPRNSPALQLLQGARDEAHRFAITYHKTVRKKRVESSALDAISGIGAKRKAALFSRFGSIDAIKAAPVDELADVIGNSVLAKTIKEKL